MSNMMLGFPNYIDSANLSGGSWLASLPLSNIKTRVLGRVARTTDDSNASTSMLMDLTKPRKIRSVAAINHNLSIGARYRVTASTDNWATTAYDSGWSDVWPVVYDNNLQEWEDDNWWNGKYTAEEMAGYTTALIHLLPSDVLAQYWRIDIDDTNNPSNYVQLGRIFIGPVWQPSVNMSTGMTLGWGTDTDVQKAIGGAKYFQRRTPYRVSKFVINYLAVDEAFSRAFEIQRQAGIDSEVLYIHDPDDTYQALRRRFLAHLTELSPIEFPYVQNNAAPFSVEELL